MDKFLKYFFPFEPPQKFANKTDAEQYKQWDMPSRQFQISGITYLTAILYIAASFLDKSWAPEHAQVLMLQLHLFFVAPCFLALSFLASKKRFYHIVMPALALSPILTMSCHAYIASQLPNYAPLHAEGFLGILWIFIVSGMTFKYALSTATICSIILLTSSYFLIDDTGIYSMYVFWILCSFSFGFIGALTLDSSRKAMFISQKKLHKLAVTDPLTGLFNRNQLNTTLTKEITRDLRYNKRFGVLIIDIDHFKNINDTFGHDMGDIVLKKSASILSSSLRESDTLIRWGGEEFIVIALEVNEEMLTNLSNKLRVNIEKAEFDKIGNITVSAGATMFNKNDTQDTLISRADKALYQAKKQGRNMTVLG